AKVNATSQFADNQNIQTGNHFRLQRRRRGQLRIQNGRAQVGKQFQVGAQTQQSFLRTLSHRQAVPFRTTDSTQQDGIGVTGLFQSFVRQRNVCCIDSSTAHQSRVEGQIQAE